jgi:hypothetical protein
MLFHQQLGWETLPTLLKWYEYYFIIMNIGATGCAGLAIAWIVCMLHSIPHFDRDDFRAIEQETLMAHPFNTLLSMAVVAGIWQFGHPILSVTYFAVLVLMEMTQSYYNHLMSKMDAGH